jgi:hypothetical protein
LLASFSADGNCNWVRWLEEASLSLPDGSSLPPPAVGADAIHAYASASRQSGGHTWWNGDVVAIDPQGNTAWTAELTGFGADQLLALGGGRVATLGENLIEGDPSKGMTIAWLDSAGVVQSTYALDVIWATGAASADGTVYVIGTTTNGAALGLEDPTPPSLDIFVATFPTPGSPSHAELLGHSSSIGVDPSSRGVVTPDGMLWMGISASATDGAWKGAPDEWSILRWSPGDIASAAVNRACPLPFVLNEGGVGIAARCGPPIDLGEGAVLSDEGGASNGFGTYGPCGWGVALGDVALNAGIDASTIVGTTTVVAGRYQPATSNCVDPVVLAGATIDASACTGAYLLGAIPPLPSRRTKSTISIGKSRIRFDHPLMHAIPITSSLLTFLEALEYTEAALLADEETHDLAKPITHEIADWTKVSTAERAARREVIRAEAVVAVRNAQLDTKTLAFGSQVVASGGGDRKGSFFRRFFSSTPSEFVRQPLRKQAEQTLNTLVLEAGKLDKEHPLHKLAPPIKKIAQAALTALDHRTTVKAARASSAHDTDEWKEGANTLLLSTYAELLKLAAENGHPKSWAAAFFPSTQHAAQAPATTGGDTPPAPPPATGSGTAAGTGAAAAS